MLHHAPYCAEHLKLATLRHYREHHQNREGTWDPMEGRCVAKSSLDEFLDRHGVSDTPHGVPHVSTAVTYQTEDTSWIYCTSLTRDAASRHEHWKVACHIRDVPGFAVLLGAEFARQRNNERHAPVTSSDWLCDGSVRCSGVESAVQVHHGPVVYDDSAADTIFGRMPHQARALAAHFFKRKAFRDQQEYRFVLHGVGGRPLLDELYLRITPELRHAFRKP